MADKPSNKTPKTGWAAFWLRLKYRLGWLDDELKQRQQVGALGENRRVVAEFPVNAFDAQR